MHHLHLVHFLSLLGLHIHDLRQVGLTLVLSLVQLCLQIVQKLPLRLCLLDLVLAFGFESFVRSGELAHFGHLVLHFSHQVDTCLLLYQQSLLLLQLVGQVEHQLRQLDIALLLLGQLRFQFEELFFCLRVLAILHADV